MSCCVANERNRSNSCDMLQIRREQCNTWTHCIAARDPVLGAIYRHQLYHALLTYQSYR